MTVPKWLVPGDDGFQKARLTISCLHKFQQENNRPSFATIRQAEAQTFLPP